MPFERCGPHPGIADGLGADEFVERHLVGLGDRQQQLQAGLAQAGLQPEAVYGYWDKSPFTPESKEIIFIARLAS